MEIKYNDNQVPYIDLGNGYEIRLEYEDVEDSESLEKASNELRETPELREKSLIEFRELIQNDKDLLFPIEDPFLLTFLRPSKFYAKSAYAKLQTFYKFKLNHQKVCSDITIENTYPVFAADLIKFWPLRDKHGRRVLYLQCGNKWDPKKVSTHDIFRAIQLSLQPAMAEPKTQINGVCVILDMEGLSISHIMNFTPSFAAMFLEWIQECIPIRLKVVYVINNSYIFNMLFTIFKPFITAKLRKRIHFLNKNYEKLKENLGEHCLSKKFGGTMNVDDVEGSLLGDFLKLFSEQFKLLDRSGYGVEDEETKNQINEGIQNVLSYITKPDCALEQFENKD